MRRRKRRGHWRAAFSKGKARIAASPGSLISIALCALLLSWIVCTKSLPYALAPGAPGIALALNPNNPGALLGKAEHLRIALLDGMALGQPEAENQANSFPRAEGQRLNSEVAAPTVYGPCSQDRADEVEPSRLCPEIKNLLKRAIDSEPLNARAFRMFGEIMDNPGSRRRLMQEAVMRSRRDISAVLWLLDDSYTRRDFKAVIARRRNYFP